MLTTKNKMVLAFSCVILLVSCAIYLLVNRNSSRGNIECSSNVEVYYNDIHFKGVFIHKLYDRFGSTLITGIIKKGDATVGEVNRRVNVEMQRNGSVVMLTSTRIIKKDNDTAPADYIKKVLPTYAYSDGGISIYDFIKQDDDSFIIMRGTLPLAYCSN